jgi:hypothetical protein
MNIVKNYIKNSWASFNIINRYDIVYGVIIRYRNRSSASMCNEIVQYHKITLFESAERTKRLYCRQSGEIFQFVNAKTDTVVPRYTSLIRSRSLDLYQTGRIPNEFFP